MGFHSIEFLHEISKTLTGIESVEQALSAALRVTAGTLSLHSAILIDEENGESSMIVWQSSGQTPERTRLAKAHARASFAYLTGANQSEVEIVERNALVALPRGSSTAWEPHDRQRFLSLPLVVGHKPAFGTFQVEVSELVDANDLVFVNAFVNQLAIALDRHHALLRAAGGAAHAEVPFASRRAVSHLDAYCGLVGKSLPMLSVFEQIKRVGPSRIRVFIRGESGTGKELLARAVHRLSPRQGGPFIAVNCGAVPSSLAESEFFGHEKGSFTGATSRHEGYFEQAHHGTLFLDEVAEMPLDLQVRLLRVLEDGVVRRVGGTKDIPVDVRVVSATNRDPDAAVAAGRLREDLFYRLHVFPIDMPPLRDRPSDIPLLARHLMAEVAESEAGAALAFTEVAERVMAHYHWPGNVRELRNVISKAWLLADGHSIGLAHLPAAFADRMLASGPAPTTSAAESGTRSHESTASAELGRDKAHQIIIPYGIPLEEVKRRVVLAYLDHFQGHRERTAGALGISSRSLYTKCQAWGVVPSRVRSEDEPTDPFAST